MRMRAFTSVAMALLASAALLLSSNTAWAQKSRSGGGSRPSGVSGGTRPSSSAYHYGGGYHPGGGGYYGGGYRYGGYGYGYRPYGYGIGIGLYAPYYGYGYGYGGYGGYAPYYSAYPPVYGGAYLEDGGSALPAVAQPAQERPAPDNMAHLQLTVPANAEVLIDGNATTQTGTTREFITPVLSQGNKYSYRITVRYPDGSGKAVEDTRDIRFQANDWFSIDFTRPAPTPPPPAPLPKITKDE
jgi:uncharacterized protein (TIGR03000 family)